MKNIFKVSACIFALSLVFTLYGCKGSGSKEETTTEFVFRPFITGDDSENTYYGGNEDASETSADTDTDSDTEVFDDGFVAGGKIMLGGNKNKESKTDSSSQKKSDTADDKKSGSSEKSSSGNKTADEKSGKKTPQKNDEKKPVNVTEETTEKIVEKETEPVSPEKDNRWGGLTWN